MIGAQNSDIETPAHDTSAGPVPSVNGMTNGVPETGAAQAQAEGYTTDHVPDDEGPSSLERAEQLADRIGAAVGIAAAFLGRKFIQIAARTREVMADCWAEAQDLRHGKKSEPPSDHNSQPPSA
jgi:hypothetical protein